MTLLRSFSPWDGQPVAEIPVDPDPAAGAAAIRAPQRAEARAVLERLSEVLVRRRAEAVALLIREAGKVAADAAAEADLLPRKIATMLDQGLRGLDDRIPDGPGARWQPRGQAVILGPFNFPLHLLHGLVVPALAVGCPVLAKPSEKTPALGAWYASCLDEAGAAPFVRIVQGGPATAAALIDHPATATVAAVGSRAMGVALARRLADRPEVVLALELGGVNHVLVREDADLDTAAPAIADGAWRLAGQRCTATRVVHVSRRRADDLIDRLRTQHQAWIPTGSPDAKAGPLIDPASRTRVLAPFLDLPPGWLPLAGDPRATPAGPASAEPLLIRVSGRDDPRYATEHFGPVLLVDVHADEAEALAAMHANPLRLAAAIWTRDRDAFARIARYLRYGLVGHNQNTGGARGDLPFGGCGLSGNGHPAGICAPRIFADEVAVS